MRWDEMGREVHIHVCACVRACVRLRAAALHLVMVVTDGDSDEDANDPTKKLPRRVCVLYLYRRIAL